MMRQNVFTNSMVRDAARWFHNHCVGPAHIIGLLISLLVSGVGCQTTQPVGGGGVPINLSRGLSSSYKPPTGSPVSTGSSDTATSPSQSTSPAAISSTAHIRGQSPTQWNSSSPGTDAYRNPMSATNATQVGTVPNSYVAPGTYNATGGQFTTAPLTLDSPPQGYAPPQQQLGGGGYAPGSYGYATPGAYQASPSEYNATIAPGVTQLPTTMQSTIAPGAFPGVDPSGVPYPDITSPIGNGNRPRQRISPIDVYVQEARTGRIILGGSLNSDLGVAGQLVIDERNFDYRAVPRSWDDLWSGRAFRGAGQNFRAEFMPGNQVQRYTVNWTERNLFGYLPYSLSVGGFYYTRQYRDWTEQRLGGRAALGYEVTPDLSISGELRLEDVNMSNPRVLGVDELDSALGSNDVYTARFRVARDTRDSPFMSTEGALLELIFDQVFGEYDFSRGNVNYSRYFLLKERADGGGRHTLASTWRFGVTGSQTPIFENYFAGGYSTLRGFSFRGASPTVNGVQVGGEMMFLGSLEYLFPLTADEMLRGVAFVDYGTVESDLQINSENFRVAPGLGLRVSVPALGPAPLAFDFAYPINHADGDDRQIFSFFMGFTR